MPDSRPRACSQRPRARSGCRSPGEPKVVTTIRLGVLPELQSGRMKVTIGSPW
jgi:hypothetical protein